MRIGQVGIITNDFFQSRKEKWAYLATAIDVTEYWQSQHPNKSLTKSYYELRYRMVQEADQDNCTVIYLGTVVIPDIMLAEGMHYKMENPNSYQWKYHKVLLTVDDICEVRFLHEKCLEFFTWHGKD